MKMKNQDRDSINEEFLYILNGINIFFRVMVIPKVIINQTIIIVIQ